MAKSAATVAAEIIDLMRKKGAEVATFPWPAFYEQVGRERMKEAFQDQLVAAMKEKSFLVVYGNSVVVIAKDFDFATI